MKSIMKKSIPLPLVVALVCVITVASAAFILSRQVSLSMSVIATYDMVLLEEDLLTELTSLVLGDFELGDSSTFGGSGFGLQNPGNDVIYVSWSISGFPGDCTISMEISKDTGTTWEALAENVILTKAIDPNGAYTLHWRFTVNVPGTAGFDDYPSITLTWDANDSS